MTERRAASLVCGTLLAAALAPWLAPQGPATSPDPAAATDRPPGTVLLTIDVGRGATWLVDSARPLADGRLLVVRRGRDTHLEPGRWRMAGPPRRFLLGTDALGRDLASRILHGLRNSVAVALAAALLALAAGLAAGSAAALGGASIAWLVTRGVDVATAVPKLFLVLAVAAVAPPGPLPLVLLLAAIVWMPVARLVRGELRALEATDFALAARAAGSPRWRILTRHHLPHLAGPLLVQTALTASELVLLEATASFLGAGLPPPTASLGGMLAEALARPEPSWWTLVFPGLAVTLPALALTAGASALDAPVGERSRSHRARGTSG